MGLLLVVVLVQVVVQECGLVREEPSSVVVDRGPEGREGNNHSRRSRNLPVHQEERHRDDHSRKDAVVGPLVGHNRDLVGDMQQVVVLPEQDPLPQ